MVRDGARKAERRPANDSQRQEVNSLTKVDYCGIINTSSIA